MPSKRLPLMLSVAAASLLGTLRVLPAFAADDSSSRQRAESEIRTFVRTQSEDGHMAVALGEVALQNSQNPEVQVFAQRIIAERTPLYLSLISRTDTNKYHASEALSDE